MCERVPTASAFYGGGGSFECSTFIYERVPITPYTKAVQKTEAKLVSERSFACGHSFARLRYKPFVFFQPLTLERITRGRVTTDNASRKTIHRRCKEMSSVRGVMSAGSSTEQLKEEVQSMGRLLSRDEWKELFGKQKFGIVDIPPEMGLAIKADLDLPWNKLRLLKR